MKRAWLVGLMLFCCAVFAAHAQFPAKPVTIIVFTPPGGPSDTAARTLATRMSKTLGQQIIVDNKPGADGSIAAQAVLNAAPDGHTLLWIAGSAVGLPLLQKGAPFKSLSVFAPVSIPVRFAFGMYVHPDVPAKTVSEFVAHAKANPGKLAFATGPLSEFLAAALFMQEAGIDMFRVPYKGGAQAMPDVIAGRVQVYFTPLSIGNGPAQSGKLRALATLLPERSPVAPNVPTIGEAGYRGVVLPSWNALFAPPRTPREVTAKLAQEVRAATQDPDVKAAYEQRGAQAVGSTPEELAAIIPQDEVLWRKFVETHRIEAQ